MNDAHSSVLPDRQLYVGVAEDFYEKQKRSINPLRRWFHTNRYRIANSLIKARYRQGTRIVDLGCGSCDWNVDRLPVSGVDLNDGLMRVGRERGRLTECLVGAASQTGFPDNSVDVITGFEFLEHLHDPGTVICEMFRVLRPGGCAIATVPYDTWVSLWRPLFAVQTLLQGYVFGHAYYRRQCGHVQHFSPASLAAEFVRAGFTIDQLFSMRRMSIFLVAVKGAVNPQSLPCPDLSIILPTLNEGRHLGRMLDYLTAAYPGARILVSDDGSTDATRETVSRFAGHNVRFLDRSAAPVHGLTASVLEAIRQVETPLFVVLDADGQHPPRKVAEAANLLRLGSDLVVGSRIEVEAEWSWVRRLLSYAGTALGKLSLLVRGKSYLSYDILSGFFGVRTEFFHCVAPPETLATRFRPKGYKVLFDLLKALPRREEIEEVYFRFETRQGGLSKLNARVYREYFKSVFR
jgi:ubiquinone/menaquinone biosynthesis C-methylase UbiE